MRYACVKSVTNYNYNTNTNYNYNSNYNPKYKYNDNSTPISNPIINLRLNASHPGEINSSFTAQRVNPQSPICQQSLAELSRLWRLEMEERGFIINYKSGPWYFAIIGA